MTKDRVLSVFLVLFLGLMYSETFKFDEQSNWQAFSSAFYPRILLALIAIPTLILVIKAFKPIHRAADIPENKRNFWTEYGSIIMQFFCFGIYAWLLSIIGFIPATILYLFASQAFLMGLKKAKLILLNSMVSVITPVVVYFIFTDFLQVWLP